MWSWLRKWLGGREAPKRPVRTRLEVEALEDRAVPAIAYHGGNLLPHVEVQALYLGSDWLSHPAYLQQTRTLDGFLKGLVNGPYMDMLSAAGYRVGRGNADAGKLMPLQLNKNAALSDDAIQDDVQAAITNGLLKAPNANRLYVVFVEDNVVVRTADGLISRTDFLGYHGAFAGHDAGGAAADIRYAVVAYPGGTVGNASVTGVSTLDDLTEVASHEIAEAATDPDVNYSAFGWYDGTANDEIADIVNQQFVYLDGFAVQRIADRNGQPMTPVGATPKVEASFVLLGDGRLYEHTAAGWTFLRSGVAAVSGEGIDNQGRAMVDVVLTGGVAYEYHDVAGWVFLDSGVRQASAGQGVSYVLYANGRLSEYRDLDDSWHVLRASGVASIDAGTDRYGVNMVDAVFSSGGLSAYSDSTGWRTLCGDVRSVSAGMMGVSVALLRDGRTYRYTEATAAWSYLGGSGAQVSAGTDQNGAALIEVLTTSGTVTQYRVGTAAISLASAVKAVGEPRAGWVDVVFSNGNIYERGPTAWVALCGSGTQAA